MESIIENTKPNQVNKPINNPPVLQTPPRSRPGSNVVVPPGSSPRPGVAFIKKNDEVRPKNENRIYCPLCGTSIELDESLDHHFEHKFLGHVKQVIFIFNQYHHILFYIITNIFNFSLLSEYLLTKISNFMAH